MSHQHPPDGEQAKFEIVFQLPPSPEGTYRHEGVDGTTVHGDASGEWTLDEDGEVDDVAFFISPGWVRDFERRDLLTPNRRMTTKTPPPTRPHRHDHCDGGGYLLSGPASLVRSRVRAKGSGGRSGRGR